MPQQLAFEPYEAAEPYLEELLAREEARETRLTPDPSSDNDTKGSQP